MFYPGLRIREFLYPFLEKGCIRIRSKHLVSKRFSKISISFQYLLTKVLIKYLYLNYIEIHMN